MSYETQNRLPPSVPLRDAVEFAELLGFERAGSYAHMGRPDICSMTHFQDRDYQSWETIELSLITTEKGLSVCTRTRIGRSAYDYKKQNDTVRAFKKRFGGTRHTDGAGYDPGPPIPPAASGCHLAMQRLDWSLTRLNHYLMLAEMRPHNDQMTAMQKVWPGMRQLDPEVFASNVLIPYITAMMEEVLKSLYVSLLRYSETKARVLRSARLSGEQLALISDGTLSVEEAIAEMMPFHLPSNVGDHFKALDRNLDILAPLRRRLKRSKTSLLDRLDALVTRRHALIHGMAIDIDLDRGRIEEIVFDVMDGMSRIYRAITQHFDWPFELPRSSNFLSRRAWKQRRKLNAERAIQGQIVSSA